MDPESEVTSSPKGFESAKVRIDARGLLCPEPLVLCKQAFAVLEAGATVHVIATDPHAEIDFEVFARKTQHALLRKAWLDGDYHVLVQKA